MKNPSEQLSGILEDFYFFDTIEGIESMPGYVRRVDSSVDKFDDIIGIGSPCKTVLSPDFSQNS